LLSPVADGLDHGHADMTGLRLDRLHHGLDAVAHDDCFDLDHRRPPRPRGGVDAWPPAGRPMPGFVGRGVKWRMLRCGVATFSPFGIVLVDTGSPSSGPRKKPHRSRARARV